jgi:hypothetical protein
MWDHIGVVTVIKDDREFRPSQVPLDGELCCEYFPSGRLSVALTIVCLFPIEDHEASSGFGKLFGGGFLFCRLCRLFMLRFLGWWLGGEVL